MNQKDWVITEGGWRHRPIWKVAINTVLRAIQFGLEYRWVVVTKCSQAQGVRPFTEGYRIARVKVGA